MIDLAALVQMKLTADRHHDRAHIIDLLHVGLITEQVRSALPPVLLERLKELVTEGGPDLLEE